MGDQRPLWQGAEPTAEALERAAENGADGFRDVVSGEWVPAACWHNCGGRCVNKVLVRDGVVVRQKTDDSCEDTADNPQQRGCVRGRSQRMQVFGPDRIKHPMKRKGWSPEAPNGQLRGKDEWERISWDEAIAYYYRRTHSCLDNVAWEREAWASPVYLNPADAEASGIADGDTVVVSSPAGKVLRPATLLASIMPGVVALPHGAWVDMDAAEEYDTAGCDNVLVGSDISASFVSGYNSLNVNVEKYDGEPLVADCDKPQRIVEL